jgi:cytochrome P450 PksS
MLYHLEAPEVRADIYPFYTRLRQNDPLARIRNPFTGEAWFLSRYEDVVMALKDPRFVNDRLKVGVSLGAMDAWWMPSVFKSLQSNLLTLDDPEHRRLRELVHKAFTPRMIERLAGNIETIADNLLNRMAGRDQVELIKEYALPLPLTVISEMLGVPESDRLKFHNMAAGFLGAVIGGKGALLLQIPNAFRLESYFKKWIGMRRQEPQDDLISGLVQAELDGDHLTDNELIAMIFLLLLAGHETSVNMIASGVYALLRFPDQRDLLMSDPSIMDSAVEEIARYTHPIEQFSPRYAREDIPLHGQVIPKGSVVVLGLASANHDETVFPEPERLNLTRSPNRHVGFGAGTHYCVGAPLARLEAKIAIPALFKRFPQLRLAVPESQITWTGSSVMRGLAALPLRLS